MNIKIRIYMDKLLFNLKINEYEKIIFCICISFNPQIRNRPHKMTQRSKR